MKRKRSTTLSSKNEESFELKNSPKFFLIYLIKVYQTYISPLFPPCCRFHPTCSAYALEAISRYGAIKGTTLSLKRILRCHPFHKDKTIKVDPVPDEIS